MLRSRLRFLHIIDDPQNVAVRYRPWERFDCVHQGGVLGILDDKTIGIDHAIVDLIEHAAPSPDRIDAQRLTRRVFEDLPK